MIGTIKEVSCEEDEHLGVFPQLMRDVERCLSQTAGGRRHPKCRQNLNLNSNFSGLLYRRPVYNKEDDFVLVVSVDKFSFPSGHASR